MGDATEKVKDAVKEWVSLDDQERELKKQIAEIKLLKLQNSEKILNFMLNGPTDREIMHLKYIFCAFWLGISVHGDFEVIFPQEGVGIKVRKGLQSNRNTKIRRVQCS